MTDRFVSHAQNREDVVLWRALGRIEHGNYIDVGANDPDKESVTRSFYDHGWSGIAIEPNPEYAERYRERRPRDTVVQAVVTDSEDSRVTLHLIHDTGLSTIIDDIRASHELRGYEVTDLVVDARRLDSIIQSAGLADEDIHFISIDTEGAEAAVLRSIDFTQYRPWVLVVEATEPLSVRRTHETWEPQLLASGYTFCLFDGLSRFYVADEKRDELLQNLDHSACIFDDYSTIGELGMNDELRRLHEAVRGEAARAEAVTAELARVQRTVSWRLTKSLRSTRRMLAGSQGKEGDE